MSNVDTNTGLLSLSMTGECQYRGRVVCAVLDAYIWLGRNKKNVYQNTLILAKRSLKLISKMLQFLIDDKFVMFSERVL